MDGKLIFCIVKCGENLNCNLSLSFHFEFSAGIIKEEELEHIDKIVKEDGWVQDDEIDYNQKLVFSDDDDSDTPPPPTTRGKEAKRVNFNDRDKDTKSSARKDEQESRMGKFNAVITSRHKFK